MKTAKILLLAFWILPVYAFFQNDKADQAASPLKKDSLVRGVSYEAFRRSVNDFYMDSTRKPLLDSSWQLWKAEKWSILEHFFDVDNLNGEWPPIGGAVSLQTVTLDSGVLIDRYGGYFYPDTVFHDSGRFVCRKGVPFAQRALRQSALTSPYRLYRIVKAIPHINMGQIIPWFNEPGLGTQFELPLTIDDLKKSGYIVEISRTPPN